MPRAPSWRSSRPPSRASPPATVATSTPTTTSTADHQSSTPSPSSPRPTEPPRSPPTPPAKDFVTDAHAHCKFIGRNEAAAAVFEAAGLGDDIDDGYLSLDNGDTTKFVEMCRALRFWDREPTVTSKRAGR